MTKIQAINEKSKKQSSVDEPPSLHGRAIDNLRFIRETMERSTHFTAVPGYGGIFMGLTALPAAFIASRQPLVKDWLTVWLVEAILAFAVGLFATWQKSKIANTPLNSAPAKKFASSFLPPLICAVVCGGAFSVKAVPVMGWCFIALGAIAFIVPANFGNLLMALSFGVLHVVFGSVIARRFGG